MVTVTKKDYQNALEEQKTEVRNLVIAGLEQIKEGKTTDRRKNIRMNHCKIEITNLAERDFENVGDYIS